MNKNFLFLQKLGILLVSVFFWSCEAPNDLALRLDTGFNVDARFTDTLDINIQTTLLDTIYSNRQSNVLVGAVNDPIFGKISATAFLEPMLSLSLTGVVVPFSPGDDAVADSVRLRFVHFGQVFGDSTNLLNLGIYRLKSPLSYTKNYNGLTDVENYDSQPLVGFSMNQSTFRNTTYDSVKAHIVRLPLSIAQELVKTGQKYGGNRKDFAENFAGFALKASAEAKGVYTFSTGTLSLNNLILTVYYHKGKDALSYDFDFSGPRYSAIRMNRSKAVNDAITKGTASNIGYVQNSTNVLTTLDFSVIRTLGNGINVSKAFLEIPVVSKKSDTFPDNVIFTLAEAGSEGMFTYNAGNQRQYIQSLSNGNAGVLYVLDKEKKLLNLDVTFFAQQVALGKATSNKALLIPVSPENISNNLGVIGASRLQGITLGKPILRMYYTRQ